MIQRTQTTGHRPRTTYRTRYYLIHNGRAIGGAWAQEHEAQTAARTCRNAGLAVAVIRRTETRIEAR